MLPLIDGDSSVGKRMPKGNGLLSSKNFALQVADKEFFFFPVVLANEINFNPRIFLFNEKFSEYVKNRINYCPKFAYRLKSHYCNIIIYNMVVSREFSKISDSHCVSCVSSVYS